MKWNTLTRLLGWVMLLTLIGALVACNSSSSDTPNPDAIRPAITGLSKNAANFNDEVEIFGLHFGTTQGSSRASLNGMDFSVTEWTDTKIKVTVNNGMSSGIVVVTVNSLSSQNGSEAQLFIPAAPGGQPLINELTPDYGVVGEAQILLTGQGFGTSSATGQVFFTAQSATSQTNLVQANVVSVDVDGTPQEQWTHSSIKVYVPATADTGPLYVVVNGVQSNSKQFTALPNPNPLNPPTITGFTPPNGEVGTVVTITGTNFGHSQGGSVITLAGQQLTVVTWNDTEIIVIIPTGAETGHIRIVVGGKDTETQGNFVVSNTPVITGVSPSQLRIGLPVTVYGQYFGAEQGAGSLRIGSTNISASSLTWSNSRIDISALQPINYTDADSIPVIVTADNGLASAPFNVKLVSDLTGLVTVNPTAGVQNTSPGASDGTAFVFTVEVAGGDGPFNYSLIPDVGSPEIATPEGASATITYYYDNKGTFTTAVRVKDTSTGDTVLIDGPSVLVVGVGEPVVTKVATATYSRAQDAPNDYCYELDAASQPLYHDFSFMPTQTIFASALNQIVKDGTPVTGYTRNHKSFLFDQSNPRPYGYRYRPVEVGDPPVPAPVMQGAVVLEGLNFGSTVGSLWLNSDGANDGFAVDPNDILSWSDTQVYFLLPEGATENLSGKVTIQVGNGNSFTTGTQLLCSPYITSITPTTNIDLATPVSVQGYDLALPQVAGMTGSQSFIFMIMKVSYTDPWTLQPAEAMALKVDPVPIVVTGGNSFTIDMSLFAGQHEVEVFDSVNPPKSEGRIVLGTPITGTGVSWYFFIWTGALTAGTNTQKALSGVFSESYELEMGTGGGPGDSDISGHVQNDVGDPMAGVTITVNPGGLTATTDAAGDYTVTGVADGTYSVTPSFAGVPPWNFAPPSRNVTLPPDATNVDFVGSQTAVEFMTINGHVQIILQENPPPNPPTFGPVEGATLNIYAGDVYPPLGPSIGTTTSNANGDYTFTNIPKGDLMTWYTIVATHPSYPDPSEWLTFWTVTQGGADTATANPLTVKKH